MRPTDDIVKQRAIRADDGQRLETCLGRFFQGVDARRYQRMRNPAPIGDLAIGRSSPDFSAPEP